MTKAFLTVAALAVVGFGLYALGGERAVMLLAFLIGQ